MGLAVAYIPYFISERNESIIVSYPITMTLYCFRPEEVLTMGTIVLAKRFEPAFVVDGHGISIRARSF